MKGLIRRWVVRRPGAGVVSLDSLHNTQNKCWITLQNYSELNSQPSPSILKTVARIHSKELSIASPAIFYIDESINSVECKEIIEDDDKEDRKLILFIRRLW